MIQTDTGKTIYFQVGFCATAVDDGEWMVLPEQMTVGNEIIWASTFGRGGMIPASSRAPGKMCGYLRYDISDLDPDWDAPVTFGIMEMTAIPREGSPCKDIMHRYETNSAAQALGFTLSCEDNAASDIVRGPKDYILKVESFDSSKWTEEEALEAVEKLLDFQISGPWTFRIEHISYYL